MNAFKQRMYETPANNLALRKHRSIQSWEIWDQESRIRWAHSVILGAYGIAMGGVSTVLLDVRALGAGGQSLLLVAIPIMVIAVAVCCVALVMNVMAMIQGNRGLHH